MQLNAWYMSTSANSYTEVTKEFKLLTCEDPYADLVHWLHQLAVLNVRLSCNRTSYSKDDLQMVSHVIHKLPREKYGQFISHHEIQGYSNTLSMISRKKSESIGNPRSEPMR